MRKVVSSSFSSSHSFGALQSKGRKPRRLIPSKATLLHGSGRFSLDRRGPPLIRANSFVDKRERKREPYV